MEFLEKSSFDLLHSVIDKRDDNIPTLHFNLKTGSIVFAILGILCWSSELLFGGNSYMSLLVGSKRLRLLYTMIILLYLSSMVVLAATYSAAKYKLLSM